MLKVTDDLNILDTAALLMTKDGIMARNDDEYHGITDDYTDHTLHVHYYDVPIFCHQSITIGSNTVDFSKTSPHDHGVETLFLKPVSKIEDRFDIWYDYRQNTTRTNKKCKSPEEENLTNGQKSSHGVLLILEAEEASTTLLDSSQMLHAAIQKALENAGLVVVSVEEVEKGSTIVFVLKEGYVVAHSWPEHSYCAFDLMLWSSFDKQDAAKAELISAVGSKTSSSYRITTGGMYGASTRTEDIGPRVTETCEDPPPQQPTRDTPPDKSSINLVLAESISLITLENTNAVVAVLCGDRTQPCSSLEVLANQSAVKNVIPLWACLSVNDSTELLACESDIWHSFEASVKVHGQVKGIVIDADAPLAMGQMLHRRFSRARKRRELLTEDYGILAVTPDACPWCGALLERFQADFVKFEPAYRAEVIFNSTESSLELGIFSSGDDSFYSHLFDVIRSIEQKTGFVSEVQNVKNGLFNYWAGHEPSQFFSHSDYDHTSALEQWRSQRPLAAQTILQFELEERIHIGDAVSIEFEGGWFPGRVAEKLFDETYRVIYDVDGSDSYGVERHMLQKMSPGADVPFFSTELLKEVMESIGHWSADDVRVFDTVGEGCIIAAFWPGGSAIASWDGRTQVSVNIFNRTGSAKVANAFEMVFDKQTLFSASITAHHDQPRGFGRVVNFQKDIGSRGAVPQWANII